MFYSMNVIPLCKECTVFSYVTAWTNPSPTLWSSNEQFVTIELELQKRRGRSFTLTQHNKHYYYSYCRYQCIKMLVTVMFIETKTEKVNRETQNHYLQFICQTETDAWCIGRLFICQRNSQLGLKFIHEHFYCKVQNQCYNWQLVEK